MKKIEITAYGWVDKKGHFDGVPIFGNYPRISAKPTSPLDANFIKAQHKSGFRETEVILTFSIPTFPKKAKKKK